MTERWKIVSWCIVWTFLCPTLFCNKTADDVDIDKVIVDTGDTIVDIMAEQEEQIRQIKNGNSDKTDNLDYEDVKYKLKDVNANSEKNADEESKDNDTDKDANDKGEIAENVKDTSKTEIDADEESNDSDIDKDADDEGEIAGNVKDISNKTDNSDNGDVKDKLEDLNANNETSEDEESNDNDTNKVANNMIRKANNVKDISKNTAENFANGDVKDKLKNINANNMSRKAKNMKDISNNRDNLDNRNVKDKVIGQNAGIVISANDSSDNAINKIANNVGQIAGTMEKLSNNVDSLDIGDETLETLKDIDAKEAPKTAVRAGVQDRMSSGFFQKKGNWKKEEEETTGRSKITDDKNLASVPTDTNAASVPTKTITTATILVLPLLLTCFHCVRDLKFELFC